MLVFFTHGLHSSSSFGIALRDPKYKYISHKKNHYGAYGYGVLARTGQTLAGCLRAPSGVDRGSSSHRELPFRV